MKKILLFVFSYFFSLFSFLNFTYALQITEVMYDTLATNDAGEWVEIYNDADYDIDLSKIYFVDTSTEKKLATSTKILKSKEFFIVDDENYSLSLSNTSGDTIGLKSGNFIKTFKYTNKAPQSATKEYTINCIFGEWVKKEPSKNIFTEGQENGSGTCENVLSVDEYSSSTEVENIPSQNLPNNSSSNSNSSNYTNGYTNRSFSLGNINMQTPKEVWTLVGADTPFFVKPTDNNGKLLNANNYWSFGDGGEAYGATTTHRYYNAGEYITFIESDTGSAYGLEKIQTHVTNPDLIIKEVGQNDGNAYVIFKNNENQDIDIGGFIIRADQGFYKLSRHLLIRANTELKVDGRVIGFSNLTNVKLLTPDKNIFLEYKSIVNQNNIIQNLPKTNDKNIIFATNTTNFATNTEILESNSETLNLIENTQITKKINFTNKTLNKVAVKNKIDESILDKTYKGPTNNQAQAQNQNTSQISVKVENTQNATKIENSKTVNSPSIKTIKNWLYWLYE